MVAIGSSGELVRAQPYWTPGGRMLDAFVRAPSASVPDATAHVVMIGGTVVCLPMPASGLELECRYALGGATPVYAFGVTRLQARRPHCYSVLACRVPHEDFGDVSAIDGPLDVILAVRIANASAAATADSADRIQRGVNFRIPQHLATSARNWTGFSMRWQLPRRPHPTGPRNGVQIAATCMVKNAMLRGERFPHGSAFVEWLEYHRLIGVGHFYIYDNGSTDGTRTLMEAYAATGAVTQVHWPYQLGGPENNRAQEAAINHALFAFGHHVAWLGFFDFDEFLAVPPGSPAFTSHLASWSGVQDEAVATNVQVSPARYEDCERALKILWVGSQLRDTNSDCGTGEHSAPRVVHCRMQHTSVGSPPKVLVAIGRRNVLPAAAFRSIHHFEFRRSEALANPCIHPAPKHGLVLKHFARAGDCSSDDDPWLRPHDARGPRSALSMDAGKARPAGAFCQPDSGLDHVRTPLVRRLEALASCVGEDAAGLPSARCLLFHAPPRPNGTSRRLRQHLDGLFGLNPLGPAPYDPTGPDR